MKKNSLILSGILLAFIIPVLLFGFSDGPKKYHKHYEMAWLGVSTKELTPQLREYFGVDEETGVLVSEVAEDSPAENSGLKAGDVIIEADEETVYSKNDLAEIIHDFNPGDEIKIDFVRNREKESINIELGKSKINKYHYFGFKPNRIEVRVPEIEFEIPEFDEEELEKLQDEIKEAMKYHNEELKEHMEELRESKKEMRINLRDELRETI